MQIEVRLFATLRENRGKVMHLDLESGTTGIMAIQQLEIPESDVAIYLRNGRDGALSDPLEDQDVLSIFPPVGGG